MGFDVYGEEPANEQGEYFRNNVWYWRPLWDFVCQSCHDILTKKDMEMGMYNDGHLINGEKAFKIAERITNLLRSGAVKKYESEYKAEIESIPDETCEHCKGTGVRNDEYVKGTCNACVGKGMKRPFSTFYPFEESNVREFLTFLENCNGFTIS